MVKYPLANQKRPSELRRSWWSPLALIDQGFFVFAGLATFWLAWLVFQEAIRTGGWWMIVLFVIFWAITAYLALPRAHRILSNFYTPDYFIGRTRTADGLLGDPINLALRGNEAQLHKAMQVAGWTLADDITPRSTWKIIVTTLRRKSYASAPISSLFLFGRRQVLPTSKRWMAVQRSATMFVFGAVQTAGCCLVVIRLIGWRPGLMTKVLG